MSQKLIRHIGATLVAMIVTVSAGFAVLAICTNHGNYEAETGSYAAHEYGSCTLGTVSYTHGYTVSTVSTHGSPVDGCFAPNTAPTAGDASTTLELAKYVFGETNVRKISPFYYMYGEHADNASTITLGTHEGIDMQHFSVTSGGSADTCDIHCPVNGTIITINSTDGRIHVVANSGERWVFQHLLPEEMLIASASISKGTIIGTQDDILASDVHLHIQIQSNTAANPVYTGKDDNLQCLFPYGYFTTALASTPTPCSHTNISASTGNCTVCGAHISCVYSPREQIIGTVSTCYMTYEECNSCNAMRNFVNHDHSFSGGFCTKCGLDDGSGASHTHSYGYYEMEYQYQQDCCYIIGWRCSCGEFYDGGTSVQHLCYPYGGYCQECESYWEW